jgi:hypothetical protein
MTIDEFISFTILLSAVDQKHINSKAYFDNLYKRYNREYTSTQDSHVTLHVRLRENQYLFDYIHIHGLLFCNPETVAEFYKLDLSEVQPYHTVKQIKYCYSNVVSLPKWRCLEYLTLMNCAFGPELDISSIRTLTIHKCQIPERFFVDRTLDALVTLELSYCWQAFDLSELANARKLVYLFIESDVPYIGYDKLTQIGLIRVSLMIEHDNDEARKQQITTEYNHIKNAIDVLKGGGNLICADIYTSYMNHSFTRNRYSGEYTEYTNQPNE